jgi:hypothetical protein
MSLRVQAPILIDYLREVSDGLRPVMASRYHGFLRCFLECLVDPLTVPYLVSNRWTLLFLIAFDC